jgi:hypothetical protein
MTTLYPVWWKQIAGYGLPIVGALAGCWLLWRLTSWMAALLVVLA